MAIIRSVLLVTCLLITSLVAPAAEAVLITGTVVDAATGKPVADAVVMVQGTDYRSRTDVDGRFQLDSADADLTTRHITAWREGYTIAAAKASGDGEIHLALETLPPDDPSYEYKANQTCGGCHTDIYQQYRNTSMGRATGDKLPQKLQFYLGVNQDEKFDGLGFGWKYFAPMMGISRGMHAMDLNHYVGTCANCHARGATWKEGVFEPHRRLHPETGKVFIDGNLKVFRFDQLAGLSVGQGREGISCEVCHSVQDVRIHHDQFGNLETVKIDRMEVIRRGDVKFGAYQDAVSPFHKTAYSPIFKKSEFCAMCHMERADDLEGVGVPSMLTLDEYPRWKANFDAGKTDKQCQSCHMYTGGQGAWSMNKAATIGVERNPDTLAGHHWRGSYFDGEMARRASNLKLRAERQGDEIVVTAEVANVGAAHKMPGGPPFRQMLLLIDATGPDGKPLTPLDSPRADANDAAHANRIIDVGGGYRKYGFFKLWELEHGKKFPEMPYLGHIGKVYNGSWVTPGFFPMEWMFQYFWIGLLPLTIGVLGWSPLRAMSGGKPRSTKPGFFSSNVGTLDRLLRILAGVLVLRYVPGPWNWLGLIPLGSGVLGWCPTYHLIGHVDTCQRSGFFAHNAGALDRFLRIVAGIAVLALVPSPWNWLGLIPLISGLLGWCPTYRLIGNVNTLGAGLSGLFSANVGTADRIFRALVGLGLLALLFWGPKTPWGALGLIPLFTAIMGSCIPYKLAGIDTRSEQDRKENGAAWMNLRVAERRSYMLFGLIMVAMAAVLPRAAAMHIWPVGGFASERVLYDTRIDYKESDTTHYRFAVPESGPANISAKLVYYRHWYFMEPIKGAEFWGADKWKYLLHELSVELPAKNGAVASADAGNHEGRLDNMPPVPAKPGAGAWHAAAKSLGADMKYATEARPQNHAGTMVADTSQVAARSSNAGPPHPSGGK